MKTLPVSDEVDAALERIARDLGQSPQQVLASLLHQPAAAGPSGSLIAFVLGPVGQGVGGEADRYLALLNWIAAEHGAEFGEFIRHESGSSRWLHLSREEIVAGCRRNLSCQIAGTPYWAILNIDAALKRRFVFRVLEFVGYQGAAIEVACAAIGLGPAVRRRGLLLLVA